MFILIDHYQFWWKLERGTKTNTNTDTVRNTNTNPQNWEVECPYLVWAIIDPSLISPETTGLNSEIQTYLISTVNLIQHISY